MFESNVILDRYKTEITLEVGEFMFESNVILDRYKTKTSKKATTKGLRVMLF